MDRFKVVMAAILMTCCCRLAAADDCDFFRQKVFHLEKECSAGRYCDDLSAFRERAASECGKFGAGLTPTLHIPAPTRLTLQPQCLSSATPSCDVYDRCFESMCSCEATSDRYFLSYGKKYCERFLSATDWSQAGRIWRDKTLICLQETIIRHLPADGQKCNCGEIKRFAIQAHVQCYTQTDASICDLGFSDWKRIYDIVDSKDLFQDAEGRKQMLEITRLCLGARASSATRNLWRDLTVLLGE